MCWTPIFWGSLFLELMHTICVAVSVAGSQGGPGAKEPWEALGSMGEDEGVPFGY